LTCHAQHTLVTQIKEGSPSLAKAHTVSTLREVEGNPLLFELHQPTPLPFARCGCVWASWRVAPRPQWPQRGKVHGLVALVAFDALPLMPGRNMRGRLPSAEATRRLAVAGPGAGAGPWPTQDIVYAASWWQGARRAGLPAPTTHGGRRRARGLRDPAMDADVVRRFDPDGVQSWSSRRRRCARHRAARRAQPTLDLPCVLGVMRGGLIHGQVDPRTDTTHCTPWHRAALGAHALLGDAIRAPSSVESCNHCSDRLSLRHPAGDDWAGRVVQDGDQRALKAVLLGGRELPDSQRPQDGRRQSFKGLPVAARPGDRGHSWRLLAHETLHGIGGDAKAVVGEAVGQARLAEAGGVCLGTHHGINKTLRVGGGVATGRAITGGQAALLGLMGRYVYKGGREMPKSREPSTPLQPCAATSPRMRLWK
jgi:hypothetical protein